MIQDKRQIQIKAPSHAIFDLIAENPTFKEKIWWFIFKPFHGLLANKVLHVIKEKIEHNHVLQGTRKKRARP
jgi:hypothetical protein